MDDASWNSMLDDTSRNSLVIVGNRLHSPQSISREMTTFVAQGWGDEYIEEDPLKQKLAHHFEKEAIILDELVTQVNSMTNASRSSKSDETSFNDHYEECMRSLKESKTALVRSQIDTGQNIEDLKVLLEANRGATKRAIADSRRETEELIEQSRLDSKESIRKMRIEAQDRINRLEEDANKREKKRQ